MVGVVEGVGKRVEHGHPAPGRPNLASCLSSCSTRLRAGLFLLNAAAVAPPLFGRRNIWPDAGYGRAPVDWCRKVAVEQKLSHPADGLNPPADQASKTLQSATYNSIKTPRSPTAQRMSHVHDVLLPPYTSQVDRRPAVLFNSSGNDPHIPPLPMFQPGSHLRSESNGSGRCLCSV